MRVGIVGGTGAMGMGLAIRLSKKNEVMIGSRDRGRARLAASKISGVRGGDYSEVAEWCEVAVVAVPAEAIDSLKGLARALSGKIVVSIINPLKVEEGLLQYSIEKGSAAKMLAEALPESRVATAFNNVPVAFFKKPSKEVIDVLIAADSRETFEEAASLVRDVGGMRPLYVGPLTHAESVERLTVMVLNAAKLNGGSRYSVRFVS